jgi:hypothetical protein
MEHNFPSLKEQWQRRKCELSRAYIARGTSSLNFLCVCFLVENIHFHFVEKQLNFICLYECFIIFQVLKVTMCIR